MSVVASIGIGSLVLVATLEILTILMSTQSHVDMKSDLLGMDSLITTVLGNRISCSSAFEGNPSRKQTIDLSGINSTDPNTHRDITIYYPGSNGGQILARENHTFGGIKITKLAVKEANLLGQDSAQNDVYFVRIAMEAEKNRRSMSMMSGVQGFKAKEYSMTLITNSNQEILSCRPKPSADFLEDICTGTGGTIDPATKHCIMSGPDVESYLNNIVSKIRLRCTRRGPSNHVKCLPGESLSGCFYDTQNVKETKRLNVWPVRHTACKGANDGAKVHAYCCKVELPNIP